ncbi:RNase E specificity factor CsrD [Tepidimonas sediminis]|uniref:RNase E specificity factor CsrD n=1 Tax=Tepidimonas sediminis TaxID=2588941 RepID=A0A554WLC0_9BURK|nr:EAL domain-containing protein [Tepidimonas sediminis]TSE24336.1 RNase E specificity factor CsrD [Tepidimonas sediminis]
MSLVKQLWLAVLVVMAVAFGGSLVLSVLSARHYLQQQLQVKNFDNATALALALTQLDKDPVTIELQVSAQFDVGHYKFIRVSRPTGEVLAERVYEGRLEGAPQWFADLIPIRTQPGTAVVQDGWRQFATVTLASHDQYAYQSLWQATQQLLAWFAVGALVVGTLGTLALRLILRPLHDVVDQAQAIAERRFVTVEEPRTPELRAVTRAMNDMVRRLKAMFAEEAARLESLRERVNHDPVTGVANREHFLAQLRDILQGEEWGSRGSLVVVRLAYLNELNARLGRQRADELLQSLAHTLTACGDGPPGQRVGRLKGGEFALVCPSLAQPAEAARRVHERLMHDWAPRWLPDVPDLFHLAAVDYARGEPVGEVLARADQALAQAQARGPNGWHAVEDAAAPGLTLPAERWRTLLTEAVSGGRLSLAFYPVVKNDPKRPLHEEGVIRLQVDAGGRLLTAGDFMPMAANLNLTAPLDLGVVRLAIEHLRQVQGDVAVNLSAETIADFGFRNQLVQLLQQYPDLCRRLLFEVPEYGVYRQFDAFRDLVRSLKALGCRVGIEHFGQRFAGSDQLASLGLDYIKVHPSYVRGIRDNPGNQEFLRGLCSMAHALGITVIALGVESRDDLPLLAQLGFDGATGPGIGRDAGAPAG